MQNSKFKIQKEELGGGVGVVLRVNGLVEKAKVKSQKAKGRNGASRTTSVAGRSLLRVNASYGVLVSPTLGNCSHDTTKVLRTADCGPGTANTTSNTGLRPVDQHAHPQQSSAFRSPNPLFE